MKVKARMAIVAENRHEVLKSQDFRCAECRKSAELFMYKAQNKVRAYCQDCLEQIQETCNV